MSIDNWSWNWSNEHGRARLLRDALEDAHAERAATSRRLTSKISQLEGTLQGKLDALSSAFDAFVELGDIREQLQELPDWRHTRRAVQASLTTLMEGERPAPLDPAEHDHWLADAMNAVVALVAGEHPGEFERRALAKSDQAALFIVTTLVALGAGERTEGRVAAVFEGVTELDDDRLVLLRAAASGQVSPEELPAIGRHLADALDDPSAWRPWLGLREDKPDPELVTDFLADGLPGGRRQLGGRDRGGAGWDYEQLGEKLVARAVVLARSGSKDEARLRTRAAQLKQKIEDPTGKHPAGPRQLAVIPTVQGILLHPDTPEASRRTMAGWLHRPLASIVEGWRELGPGPELEENYRMTWGPLDQSVRIKVTKDGADPSELRSAERQIQNAESDKGHVNLFLGGAVAAAVVGLLTLFAGSDWVGLAVVLLLVAVVLAVVGVLRKRAAAGFEGAKADGLRKLRDGVKQRADGLRAKDAERAEQTRETTEALDALQDRLGRPPAPVVEEVTSGPDFRAAEGAEPVA